MEADYYKKVEPMKYTFLLILGVLGALLTLNFLTSILIKIIFDMTGNTKLGISYMNSLIELFINKNLDMINAVIFLIMSVYLLMVAIRGNSTYGFRFACFTFYPLTENETQLNSFLFNALILNMISTCIVSFTCSLLPSFVYGT